MCSPHDNHSLSPTFFVSGSPGFGGIFFHFSSSFWALLLDLSFLFFCLPHLLGKLRFLALFACAGLPDAAGLFALTWFATFLDRCNVSPESCSNCAVRVMICSCSGDNVPYVIYFALILCINLVWSNVSDNLPLKYFVCKLFAYFTSVASPACAYACHKVGILSSYSSPRDLSWEWFTSK